MVSKEVNGGVKMAKLIQDLLKEAEVLNKTEPEKWPANDKAKKVVVVPVVTTRNQYRW